MSAKRRTADSIRPGNPRRRIALGMLMLGLLGLPGCRHIGDFFYPPLPGSDARSESRVALRVLSASEIDTRNRKVQAALRALTVKPETIRELAAKFAADRENGAEPSEQDRLRFQRAYGELDHLHRSLLEIDREILAFRARRADEDHARYARLRSDFYACIGFVDAYASQPALNAFTPSATATPKPGFDDPRLQAAGLLLGASRYTARHGALANDALYQRSRPGSTRLQQRARIVELQRSFAWRGRENLALRILFRLDFDEPQALFRLSPVYLWLDESTVKVGGLQARSARGAWGWLWPWMWGHAIWGAVDDDLYAIEIEAQVEIEAIVGEDSDARAARRLGAMRFQLGRAHAKGLPYELSCCDEAGAIRSLPSPSLPLPPTATATKTLPIDMRITIGERNRFGHALTSIGGLFSRDQAELDEDLPETLGFDIPRALTSDPAPPPPAEPDRP